MNFNPRHFLRMARWAKHPPSERRVKMIFGIVLVCLVLFAVERLFGWPAWLTMSDGPKSRIN